MLGYEYHETSHWTSLMNEYCYDILLLDSLQSLLKCDSIVEQVRSVMIAHPGSRLVHDVHVCINPSLTQDVHVRVG